MIQRIQSFYLFLTTLFSGLFLSGNIIKFTDTSGNMLAMTFSGLARYSGNSTPETLEHILPILVITLVIAVSSLVTIFLFKNRKLQIKLTMGLITLVTLLIILVAAYSIYFARKYDASFMLNIKMFLPLLIATSVYLAYRGIKKDEELVKSYERLR